MISRIFNTLNASQDNTPEEHVKEYNKLLRELAEKYDSQWRPHEHI